MTRATLHRVFDRNLHVVMYFALWWCYFSSIKRLKCSLHHCLFPYFYTFHPDSLIPLTDTRGFAGFLYFSKQDVLINI